MLVTPRAKVIWQKKARRWSWTIRKAKAARIAPEAKCSPPAEVLALQGRRLFRTRELAAEARQERKAEGAQFRLKAAHVLWATAKCRHPGSAKRAGGPARRLRPNKVWSCVGYSEKLTQCVAAAAVRRCRDR
ncbi:hypothetical protein H839_11644 [Parageobacillus genomosp. 1]|uniref:Uncharacterized protein n=1 Tax=Parageobacillus genomosp. 1 TaxID=1295642 RepID=A0ABC9VCC2_9BACL|nr:hypothetical protein H839_11644 [Parageobacillus genomosp. 1]